MYPCKRCGCCCRQIGKTFLGRSLALPNGICRYLDVHTNLCTIYSTRPLFCRVDESYERYFQQWMSRKEFYQENQKACQLLFNKSVKSQGRNCSNE